MTRNYRAMAALAALAALLAATSCAGTRTASPPAANGHWETLFDGRNLDQWRSYGGGEPGDGWHIENGSLALAADGAGDIVTRKLYRNFELELDWRISEGGNSGIFILVEEDENPIYHNAPEIQILDDARHPDREIDSHRSGSLYDMVASHPAARKPQGEWNTVRVRLKDGLLEIWQNGVPTTTLVIGSSTWNTLLASSKFRDWPGFGARQSGRIGLQDHGDAVWFRNIRVRELH
jgi:3-keto-disaccharide hydrolase